MPWIYLGYIRGKGAVYVNRTLTSLKVQRYAGYKHGVKWRCEVLPDPLKQLKRWISQLKEEAKAKVRELIAKLRELELAMRKRGRARCVVLSRWHAEMILQYLEGVERILGSSFKTFEKKMEEWLRQSGLEVETTPTHDLITVVEVAMS